MIAVNKVGERATTPEQRIQARAELMDRLHNIPAGMQERQNWIVFRKQWRADSTVSKIPCSPMTGKACAVNDPANFADFQTAIDACSRFDMDGIGFAFTPDAGMVGIDFDHVLDDSGLCREMDHEAFITLLKQQTYVEVSPSRDGIHAYLMGVKPDGDNRASVEINGHKYTFEMYDRDRYFTVTGNKGKYNAVSKLSDNADLLAHFQRAFIDRFKSVKANTGEKKTPVAADVQAGGTARENVPVKRLFDKDIISKLQSGKKSAEFRRLWKGDTSAYANDSSAADMALIGLITYYTGDRDQISRIAYQSGLYRPKWDEKHGRDTYINITIDRALADGKHVLGYWIAIQRAKEQNDRILKAYENMGFKIEHPKEYNDTDTGRMFARLTGSKCKYWREGKQWITWNGKVWETNNPTIAQGIFHLYVDAHLADLEQMTEDNKNDMRECLSLPCVSYAGVQAPDNAIRNLISHEKRHFDKSTEMLCEKENIKFEFNEQGQDSLKELDRLRWNHFKLQIQAKKLGEYKKAPRIKGALEQARAYSQVTTKQLDANPYDLNTPKGIYDLRTGKRRPHDPAALCTKMTGDFDEWGTNTETARAAWNAFLSGLFDGDTEEIEYMQYLAGQIATGEILTEGMYWIIGVGGNGKSTFTNVLLNAFGDYKETIQSEFFVTDTRENTERQKAKLMGTRLVVSNEIDPSHIIDVARIKEITSTTELDGRKLYQEAQTFKPSHTILVTANDFLRIPEKSKQDQALLSRLILIPTAQESIRDTSDDIKQYGAVLWRNCSAVIMDWIIQGAVKFNAAGGRMPQPSEPMRKYREKVLDTTGDVLDDFLKMCTVCTDPKEGKYIFSKDFVDFLIQFADYRGETDRNKIKTPNALNKAMTDRGYTIKRKSAGNAIENISWLDPNTGELK